MLTPAQRMEKQFSYGIYINFMAAPSTLPLIPEVLSLIQKHHLKMLLMGGQACVLYGAVEFCRDFDLVLLLDTENL